VIREFSSGGVVYKEIKNQKGEDKVFWLLTKSKPSKLFPKSVWRLPKGWLDDVDDGKKPGPLASGKIKATEEDLQEAAIREVREEGGIEAEIISKLGTEKYFLTISDKKILKFVTFYLMKWKHNLSEGFGFETESVEWLPYKDVYEKLSYPGEKRVLEKAKETLGKNF